MLDESRFLSAHGLRALSARHRDEPFVFQVDGFSASVRYEPGESESGLFGGNSNWRGPVWFPVNYLLIEAVHGDTGAGLGASHQTGWTALVADLLLRPRGEARSRYGDSHSR